MPYALNMFLLVKLTLNFLYINIFLLVKHTLENLYINIFIYFENRDKLIKNYELIQVIKKAGP